jgi:signal transduction histidine kinase
VTEAAGPVPGSGIGLAVVKALAQAHGGRVGVESAAGGGARFWFELPVPRPAEPTGGPAAAAGARAAGARPSG